MKPWQPGDPIGMGEVYLPTAAVSRAYTQACLHAMSEAEAQSIARETSLERRRARISAAKPEKHRDWLRARVGEIWAQRKAERDAGLR